jgi:WD40 repeat protein
VAGDGLQLWSTANGQRIGGPLPSADAADPVAFSPDGRLVAAIGKDGKARLWQVATQRETGTAVTAGPGAGALAFSPGGKIFATVGANGTAALWSVATQRRIGALMNAGAQGSSVAQAAARGRPTAAVAFSPDGTTLATAGAGGSARLWDVAFPAGLLAAACAIADQSLTRQQWADYAGTQPFQQVCPAS